MKSLANRLCVAACGTMWVSILSWGLLAGVAASGIGSEFLRPSAIERFMAEAPFKTEFKLPSKRRSHFVGRGPSGGRPEEEALGKKAELLDNVLEVRVIKESELRLRGLYFRKIPHTKVEREVSFPKREKKAAADELKWPLSLNLSEFVATEDPLVEYQYPLRKDFENLPEVEVKEKEKELQEHPGFSKDAKGSGEKASIFGADKGGRSIEETKGKGNGDLGWASQLELL